MLRVFLYIDAPQHFRIAAALIDTIAENAEIVVVTAVPTPESFRVAFEAKSGSLLVVREIHVPMFVGWPRSLRVLLRGLIVNTHLRRLTKHITGHNGAPIRWIVFNDTGIPQRYLIVLGRHQGWRTVLVQDGLTETQHRETSRSFALKWAFTEKVLVPLGFGYLGTSAYGRFGANTVFADGPIGAEFFRKRAPFARVVETGFIRPSLLSSSHGKQSYVLFWAVDFLGGLLDQSLHELQLRVIEEVATSLSKNCSEVRLRVRLHPGDAYHFDTFQKRLGNLANVDISYPSSDPFACDQPVTSFSLQSAGVFDALAARIPSFFLIYGKRSLAPEWIPQNCLLHDSLECTQVVQRMINDPRDHVEIWRSQVLALRSRMQIPFDADAVLKALL